MFYNFVNMEPESSKKIDEIIFEKIKNLFNLIVKILQNKNNDRINMNDKT